MPVLREPESGRPLAWHVCSRNVITFREWCTRQPFIREDAETLKREFTENPLFSDEEFWIEPIREEYKYRDKGE